MEVGKRECDFQLRHGKMEKMCLSSRVDRFGSTCLCTGSKHLKGHGFLSKQKK